MKNDGFVPDYLQIPYPIYLDDSLQGGDRIVYGIVYWFQHMSRGECIASNEAIAKIIGINPRSVRNALERLEERKYISREYKDTGRRNRVRINALVSYKGMFPREKLMHHEGKVDASGEGKVDAQIKININKDKKNTGSQGDPGLIVSVIDLFKEANPTEYRTWYKNTTQRAAADRLIGEYGFEKIRDVMKLIPRTNRISYFPTITTPDQLSKKWTQLEAAFARMKSQKEKKAKIAFV
ncbi:MAG: helix-turn-helix domain-containing protein [Candidatus Limnocylindrales bacterium]